VFSKIERDFKFFNVITVDEVVKKISVQLLDTHAANYNLRTLDSLQLSSALLANSFNTIDFFISSDNNLLDVAAIFFSVKNPVEM